MYLRVFSSKVIEALAWQNVVYGHASYSISKSFLPCLPTPPHTTAGTIIICVKICSNILKRKQNYRLTPPQGRI